MRGSSSTWTVAAVGIASVVAVPSLAVLATLAHPAREVWAHLWRTQLLELIGNTLALLAGVGAGTLVLGTGSPGWSSPIVPGASAARVGADPAPGDARLRDRLRVPRPLRLRRGRPERAAPAGSAPGVRLPELRSYWGVVLMMTLVFYPYVYLLARAAFREQGAATLGDGAQPRRSRTARLRPGHPADGPPLAGRRRLAGHDGGARRLRHRRHVRVPHAHRGQSIASGTACSIARRPSARQPAAVLRRPAARRSSVRSAGAPASRRASAGAGGSRPRLRLAPALAATSRVRGCSGSPSSCRWRQLLVWARERRRLASRRVRAPLLGNTVTLAGSPAAAPRRSPSSWPTPRACGPPAPCGIRARSPPWATRYRAR